MLSRNIPDLKISRPKRKIDIPGTLMAIPVGETRRYELGEMSEGSIRVIAGTLNRREGRKMFTVNIRPGGLIDVTRLE